MIGDVPITITMTRGYDLWTLTECCSHRASQGRWAPRGTPGPPGYRGSQDCKAARVTRVKEEPPGSQARRETWCVWDCGRFSLGGKGAVSWPALSLFVFFTGTKRCFGIPWCRRNSRKFFIRLKLQSTVYVQNNPFVTHRHTSNVCPLSCL